MGRAASDLGFRATSQFAALLAYDNALELLADLYERQGDTDLTRCIRETASFVGEVESLMTTLERRLSYRLPKQNDRDSLIVPFTST